MNIIRIADNAISEQSGIMFPGVITSLYDLQKAGFTFSADRLPPEIMTLFQNENIHIDESDGKETSGTTLNIESNGGQLMLKTAEDEVQFGSWSELAAFLLSSQRKGSVKRNTRETHISVEVNLDGSGEFTCQTGLGFFDHMLEQIARHGGIDLHIRCDGDLQVDEHHTVEDVALALGSALDQAFGDRRGIERYGFVLPMDESRATVALDLSGRPYLVFEAEFNREKVGDLPTEMVKHFFYSLAMNLRATLHIEVKGENEHHMIEACFKGFAKCLKSAKLRTGFAIPSSKGIL